MCDIITTMTNTKELQYFHERRLRRIWHGMKTRCYNPASSNYKTYGRKGIKICSEWDKFEAFSEWAVSNGYTNNLTIDRIDSNKDYSPDNCQWLTRADNSAKRSFTLKKEDLEAFKIQRQQEFTKKKLDQIETFWKYFDRLKILKNKYSLKARKYISQSKCGAKLKLCEKEKSMKMLQDDWQKEYQYAGSYQTAIMRACELADMENLIKLSTIYPEIVNAYRKFAGLDRIGEK